VLLVTGVVAGLLFVAMFGAARVVGNVERRNLARRLAVVVDVNCATIHQQPDGQNVRIMGRVSTSREMCGGSVTASFPDDAGSLDYEQTMLVRGVKLTVFANTVISGAVNELQP
jgi:hypothetical protein